MWRRCGGGQFHGRGMLSPPGKQHAQRWHVGKHDECPGHPLKCKGLPGPIPRLSTGPSRPAPQTTTRLGVQALRDEAGGGSPAWQTPCCSGSICRSHSSAVTGARFARLAATRSPEEAGRVHPLLRREGLAVAEHIEGPRGELRLPAWATAAAACLKSCRRRPGKKKAAQDAG